MNDDTDMLAGLPNQLPRCLRKAVYKIRRIETVTERVCIGIPRVALAAPFSQRLTIFVAISIHIMWSNRAFSLSARCRPNLH